MPNRHPAWLRKKIVDGHAAVETDRILKAAHVNTVCDSARCPNRNECYSQKTATYLIMGDICTRGCHFCSVKKGVPQPLDLDEPRRIALTAKALGLEHVVVTSVTRDDLGDEGAQQFCLVVEALKKTALGITIELLTPDFKKTKGESVARIVSAAPDVFGHNIETVPGLYKLVRPQADYTRSLEIFREIKRFSEKMATKSGLMLGLGEKKQEVLETLKQLHDAGCDILTLGQYLQSDKYGLEVTEYIHPEIFSCYKSEASKIGFKWVESAPFVRSSFHARDTYQALMAKAGSPQVARLNYNAEIERN